MVMNTVWMDLIFPNPGFTRGFLHGPVLRFVGAQAHAEPFAVLRLSVMELLMRSSRSMMASVVRRLGGLRVSPGMTSRAHRNRSVTVSMGLLNGVRSGLRSCRASRRLVTVSVGLLHRLRLCSCRTARNTCTMVTVISGR
uniref:Uncharacterized protein n=1 Tax=Anopheles atroparvus TaxID=41427 RepID=A0AAG5D3M9_ANOAO